MRRASSNEMKVSTVVQACRSIGDVAGRIGEGSKDAPAPLTLDACRRAPPRYGTTLCWETIGPRLRHVTTWREALPTFCHPPEALHTAILAVMHRMWITRG